MDVSLSQVGQNFAELNERKAVRNESAPSGLLESSEPGSVLSASRSINASQDLADNGSSNDETLNSNSVNIEAAVEEINSFVQSQNRQLSFSVDENSQRSVVRVTDSESGDVIRQIPSEEVLRLSERIRDLQSDVGAAVGVLFNREV